MFISQEAPIGVAQHVNLGLIPSSEESWEAGCRALDPSTGGILHIHGNVESSGRWSDHCADQQKVHEQTVPTLHRDQRKLKPAWSRYGQYVSRRIADVFREIDSALWSTHVQYIGCVKSYAPHVDHLVIDVQCQPCSQDQVT